MRKNELVSIILPTYNEDKYIRICLESLLNQSYSNTEIIVIDDGSIDLTRKIVNSFKKYKVKLITTTHGGPGKARNEAVSIAKGKILVFADGDMVYDKNYIKKLIHPILNNSCIGTYTTSEYVANIDNIWAKCGHINSNSMTDTRVIDTSHNIYRAIIKDIFISSSRFNPSSGYVDDRLYLRKGLESKPVTNAICYHYNPETLIDVFFSSRWIGRSSDFKWSIHKLFSYSIFNSVRNGIIKIVKQKAPLNYLIFKIVFDFGIIIGMLDRNLSTNYAK